MQNDNGVENALEKIIHSLCFARRILCLSDVFIEVDVVDLQVPIVCKMTTVLSMP